MPNHVENDLTIEGKPEDIKQFISEVAGDSFVQEALDERKCTIDANKLVPEPEKYKGCAGFNSGGYEWRKKHWGTKWGFYDFTEWNHKGKKAKISFQSAWNPAIPLFEAMAKKFPRLNITVKYFETQMQFQGVWKSKNGEVIENSTKKYTGSRGG